MEKLRFGQIFTEKGKLELMAKEITKKYPSEELKVPLMSQER